MNGNRMTTINEAAERELARLAAAHYGLPETDIPALMAFERHCAEQKKILGMPGLAAVPCFIAGFHAGQADRASLSQPSAAMATICKSCSNTGRDIFGNFCACGLLSTQRAAPAPEMQASHGAAVVEPIMGYVNLETLDCAIAFYQNKIPDGYLPFYLAPVGPVSPTPSTDSAADARDAWISVEDRLPEVDEDGCANVWAVEIGSVGFSRSPQAGVTRYHKTLGWQPQGATGWDWVITYWMPFPALPAAIQAKEG